MPDRPSLASVLEAVRESFGPRQRRTWMGQTRAHVELRDLSGDELERFASALRQAAEHRAQVKWVEVNPHTRRAVIEIERGAYTLGELVELVEAAEKSVGVDKAAFSETAAEHPADAEPLHRVGLFTVKIVTHYREVYQHCAVIFVTVDCDIFN